MKNCLLVILLTDIQHLAQQPTIAQPESAVIDDLMDKTILARFTFISENTFDRVLDAYSALKDPIQVDRIMD
jgi:hypothetical protein